MADGTLYVVFDAMPPFDFEDSWDMGLYHDFDAQMSAAIGVPVFWEDREFFRIDLPQPDTIDRVTAFISTYRSRANPADQAKFGSEGTCFERNCTAEHPFAVGQRVRHFLYGDGEVINYDSHGSDASVRVRFADSVNWLTADDPAKLWAI